MRPFETQLGAQFDVLSGVEGGSASQGLLKKENFVQPSEVQKSEENVFTVPEGPADLTFNVYFVSKSSSMISIEASKFIQEKHQNTAPLTGGTLVKVLEDSERHSRQLVQNFKRTKQTTESCDACLKRNEDRTRGPARFYFV